MMMQFPRPIRAVLIPIAMLVAPSAFALSPKDWAEIQVLDEITGRGVPLVELETVHHLRFVTDNAGRIAFQEPELMGREIFFFVRSHGYEVPKDGFGYAGVRITPRTGKKSEIRIQRRNLAERLCRLTGEGRYRDSQLLGYPLPIPESPHPGHVAGQDSIQAARYRDRIYWFWGDTQRMGYPLGLFRVAGATTPIPNETAAHNEFNHGLPYDYFIDEKSGFARAMLPLRQRPEGVIWIDGVCVVSGDEGQERMVAHYSRRKGLAEELEHGIAVFHDDTATFEPAIELPLTETWRHPSGHALEYEENGVRWLLFGNPSPNVRVSANLSDVLNPQKYEAFTCAVSAVEGKTFAPDRRADGSLNWRWQRDLPPVTSKMEQTWVQSGKLKRQETHFFPQAVTDMKKRIVLHNGTVRWNSHRQRWIMLAGELGGKTSLLGEVWYAEAKSPTGPFTQAARVVTHDRQSFYNVCQHAWLNQSGGRYVHFEGTYTKDFSGNPDATPRYDYNQILYRLDLDDPALRPAFVD